MIQKQNDFVIWKKFPIVIKGSASLKVILKYVEKQNEATPADVIFWVNVV